MKLARKIFMIREWGRRYIPAEIFGIIGAVLGSVAVYAVTNNRIASAYAGTLGENIFYYGFILAREFRNNNILESIRNIIIEFGPAEMLDSMIVRPFCMFLFPIILDSYAIGIIAGKLFADVIFYIPTVISYELRKRYIGNI